MPGFKTSTNSVGSGIIGDQWFLQVGSPYYGWRWGDAALVAIFSQGKSESLVVRLTWDPVDSIALPYTGGQVPKDFALSQNFPNPFNAGTTIKYDLPRACQVKLQIFNILGQEVRTVIEDLEQPGYKIVHWDGKDDSKNPVASGVYFYKIKAGDFVETRKMVLMK